MSESIGFIGLGIMGSGMAANLLRAGFDLTVWNRTPERAEALREQGAKAAESPAALAGQCDIIITCVSDTPDVEAVILGPDGAVQGIRPGSLVIDCSTISPIATRELAGRLSKRGAHMLDAPVSGGASGARRASLAVMVGGDEALYNRIKPVLDAIGDKVTYIGDIGCGTIAKIVHNMVSLCSRVAIAEGLTLGVKAGVSPRALLDAIQHALANGHEGHGQRHVGPWSN